MYEDYTSLRHIKIDISGAEITLQTWETVTRFNTGQYKLRYELTCNGKVIFSGDDYGCAPSEAVDSDESLRGLLGFLSLQPGDTDDEYFDDYTKDQMAFAESYGEELSLYALKEEEEYPVMGCDNLDDWTNE